MGVSEGDEKIEGIQKIMTVERGVLSRYTQGLASWSQVLIVSEVIKSWSWLVSLLGARAVGVYITSPILRSNYFGLQNIEITHYDSMFGVMKDVSYI